MSIKNATGWESLLTFKESTPLSIHDFLSNEQLSLFLLSKRLFIECSIIEVLKKNPSPCTVGTGGDRPLTKPNAPNSMPPELSRKITLG